jgi:hypothetical protein
MPSDKAVARFLAGNDFMMEAGKAKINDLRNVTKRLEAETRAGGLADPARKTVKIGRERIPVGGNTAWSRVGITLGQGPSPPGYRAAVERFYLAWWNAMTRYQLDNPGIDPGLCHRGSAGYALAVNRWAGGDHGSAVRWCVLAHLADRLEGDYDGAAEQMLVATLGVPTEAVDEIARIASTAREIKRKPKSSTRASRGRLRRVAVVDVTPEVLLLKVIGGSHFSSLLRETPRLEHEINPALYDKLRLRGETGSGQDLELLAAYLVSLLPGYRPRRNTLSGDYASENDVIAAHSPYARPLVSDQASSILIECKNWRKDRLGTSVVGYFYSRMLILNCRLGVLISQRGVTRMGDKRVPRAERAGEAMIRRLFHETGRVVLSLDADALRRVAQYGSFLQVLRERHEDFVFGAEKNSLV